MGYGRGGGGEPPAGQFSRMQVNHEAQQHQNHDPTPEDLDVEAFALKSLGNMLDTEDDDIMAMAIGTGTMQPPHSQPWGDNHGGGQAGPADPGAQGGYPGAYSGAFAMPQPGGGRTGSRLFDRWSGAGAVPAVGGGSARAFALTGPPQNGANGGHPNGFDLDEQAMAKLQPPLQNQH